MCAWVLVAYVCEKLFGLPNTMIDASEGFMWRFACSLADCDGRRGTADDAKLTAVRRHGRRDVWLL